MKILELIKVLLNISTFQPGYYIYLGRYTDDRDLKILGLLGPFGSYREAKQNVPSWWKVCGIDKPKIRFRLFKGHETHME